MISTARILAGGAVAVAHFCIALALGPTQRFYCIAQGDCLENFRRPRPETAILDWPISSLPPDLYGWLLGYTFPSYALINAVSVAAITWLVLCVVARVRRRSASH